MSKFALAALGMALLMPLSGAHSAANPNLDPAVLPNPHYVEEEPQPFVEDQTVLPPMPQQGNMLPFDTGPTSALSYALDAKSLSIGKDGVIRYTVTATSRSGAVNVIYEGLRCKTFEYRQYALGHKNGKWALSRDERWKPVTATVLNQSHSTLARDFFCQAGLVFGTASEIVERIRYNRRVEY